jgi:hypothetical protein
VLTVGVGVAVDVVFVVVFFVDVVFCDVAVVLAGEVVVVFLLAGAPEARLNRAVKNTNTELRCIV